ncbi:MAG: hypothetical protein L0214_07595 [candidate division NC10 bacterium]|nr:hypothetical protein [candidate division NC10 bacterium]
MSVTTGLVVAACALFCESDVRRRVIHNWQVAALTALCASGWYLGALPFSWWAVVLAGLLGLLAGVPGGDVKGLMLLGGLLGPDWFLVVFGSGVAAAALALALHRLRWLPYPGEWPLFPFFAVPACAIVLGGSTWQYILSAILR